MAMPGRVYPEPAAAPGSLSMPGGVISGYNSNSELLTNAADNFTIELWVKPTETHQIDIEGYWFNQYGGTSGQKYVIDPAHAMYFGNSTDESGAGVSVGTNGVSVYEHSGGYMPPMLVWQGNVTEWTHVAVVYENKTPRLYINGELVRTGVTSPKIHVYPGTLLASGSYGSMAGQVDEVRIWKVVRTQQQIQDGMYHSVSSPQPNLEAYWPIQPDETTTVADQSGNNHNVTLPTANYTSSNNTAPVGTDGYRYGFNGQEKSDEIKGSGNSYTAEFWEYDPRLGRRWNVDPVIKPWESPYAVFSNNPVLNIDPLGNTDSASQPTMPVQFWDDNEDNRTFQSSQMHADFVKENNLKPNELLRRVNGTYIFSRQSQTTDETSYYWLNDKQWVQFIPNDYHRPSPSPAEFYKAVLWSSNIGALSPVEEFDIYVSASIKYKIDGKTFAPNTRVLKNMSATGVWMGVQAGLTSEESGTAYGNLITGDNSYISFKTGDLEIRGLPFRGLGPNVTTRSVPMFGDYSPQLRVLYKTPIRILGVPLEIEGGKSFSGAPTIGARLKRESTPFLGHTAEVVGGARLSLKVPDLIKAFQ